MSTEQSLVARIDWTAHESYALYQVGTALQIWQLVGEAEPKKMYSFDMEHAQTNWREILIVLAQKYHSSPKLSLATYVNAIVAANNAIVRVLMAKQERELAVFESEVTDG